MAGLRLGVLYASTQIISVLNKIKPPYNINVLSQQKAIEILQLKVFDRQVIDILNEREILMKAMQNISFIKKIIPSDANFILIQVDDANTRYKQFINHGIVIRNRSNEPLCANCLRISIGTKRENEQVIKLIKTLENA